MCRPSVLTKQNERRKSCRAQHQLVRQRRRRGMTAQQAFAGEHPLAGDMMAAVAPAASKNSCSSASAQVPQRAVAHPFGDLLRRADNATVSVGRSVQRQVVRQKQARARLRERVADVATAPRDLALPGEKQVTARGCGGAEEGGAGRDAGRSRARTVLWRVDLLLARSAAARHGFAGFSLG